jgi:general secretion pathway protein D
MNGRTLLLPALQAIELNSIEVQHRMKHRLVAPVAWLCVALIALAGCSGTKPSRRGAALMPPPAAVVAATVPPGTAPDNASRQVEEASTRSMPPAGAGGPVGETEFLSVPGPEARAALPSVPVARGSGERVQLNLQEADVRAVIDVVLGDTLKVGYTVSAQVQGKVTLRTARPLTSEELLLALESALASVSAALVVQGNQYEVIPLDTLPLRVRQAYRQQLGERSVPGHAVQIVQLRYASAADLQRLLEVVAPKGSVLQADPSQNHIVISGSGVDRAMLLRTIEALDNDTMRGMSFAFYKLQHIGAEQIVNDLRQVFRSPSELLGNRVRLVPLERMRTLIGVAPQRADLEWLETWVRRLDAAPAATERRLFVHHVQHGSAKDLAETLQLVLTGEAPPAGLTKSARANLNTSGRAEAPLPGMPASQWAPPAAEAVAATPAAAVAARGTGLRIVANEDNNSLVVLATEAEYRLLRDAMLQLDQPARQVLIEAVIAEVTLGDELRFGVQWFFDAANSQSTLSSVASGAVASQFPGFSYFRSSSSNARLVINALQARTDVKVLSAPRLAVLNNRRAQLLVGDEVPTLSQTAQGTLAPGAPLVSTIQMRDTGVMLEVVPRISENGNVILEVTQEVSDVATTTTSGIDSPTIQRRRLRSVISTRDGATVALGGLIRETQSLNRSGVPVLKDVPWLGALFRTDNVLTRRTELIVLMVPRVIRNTEEAQSTLDDLMGGFKAANELMRDGIRVPLQLAD